MSLAMYFYSREMILNTKISLISKLIEEMNMKTLIKVLIASSVIFSSVAFAHVNLEKSMPANNAMLMKPPAELSLSFSKDVRVIKLILKNNQDKEIELNFKPSKKSSTKFLWELPKLTPSNYMVDVTYLGEDGHKMKSKINFMVH